MRFNLNDTITAIATPPGVSALALIRVSGKDAIQIVSSIFSNPEKIINSAGYQALHGYIVNSAILPDNQKSSAAFQGCDKDYAGLESHTAGVVSTQKDPAVIDEVICLIFRNPHSFTGEDMVEISGHGNPGLTSRILQLLLKSCRPAEPGEFTFRAFMNHKLDLAQSEAVSDLIHALTAKAEKAALNQLKGALSSEITFIIADLTDARIQFELAIDFADQNLPQADLSSVKAGLDKILLRLTELHQNGAQGRILRDGFTVCLTGAPNVGKSSVFNLFLEENRAIVTAQPGTTRDYLEEWLSLQGFPIRLFDTAGLRETIIEAEQLGINKTKELQGKADLNILLFDPDTFTRESLSGGFLQSNTILILNKIDLLGFDKLPSITEWNDYLKGSRFSFVHKENYKIFPCSTIIPNGIERIKEQILARIKLPDSEVGSVLVTNTRHLAAIERTISALSHAISAIQADMGYEFIAFDLIEAVSALSEITGAVTTDDMLDRIFSSFCIGK
jgi:tRNA modification GTPase